MLRVTASEDHSQLVIRSNEWDRESGTEIEEGLDGKRDLLVVVEWDVLQHTFFSFPLTKRRFLRKGRTLYSPCMPRDWTRTLERAERAARRGARASKDMVWKE